MGIDWIHHLTPDAASACGFLAGACAVVGLFLWGAGIKVARIGAALFLGLILGAVGMWKGEDWIHVEALAGGLLGFALGLALGAVSFKFLQASLLACCLSMAVAGGYWAWEGRAGVEPKVAATQAAATAGTRAGANDAVVEAAAATRERGAAGVMVNGPTAVAGQGKGEAEMKQMAKETVAAWALEAKGWVMTTWAAMPSGVRWRMELIAGLTELGVMVLAVRFVRHATWVSSSAAGTVLLAGAAWVWMAMYMPQAASGLEMRNLQMWGGVVIVMLLGMLMQRVLFWPKKKVAEE